MQKKTFIRTLLLLVSLSSLSIPYVFLKPINIFPNGITNNGYASSDSEHGGNSVSEVIEHNNSVIEYKSHLKSDYKHPYTGYSLSFDPDKLHLKARNKLRYKITSTSSKNLRINIGLRVPGKNHFIYESIIETGKTEKFRVLPLSYFNPVDWWYASYGLSKKSFPPPAMDNVAHFSIVSSGTSPLNSEETIKIFNIEVFLDPTPFIFVSILSIVVLIFFELQYRSKKSLYLSKYKEIEIQNSSNPEEAIIIKYIGDNYNRPDLTVEVIAADTGISKYKIPKIVKDRFNLTFPGYLNEIRMKEIKRLLIETELPVLDLSLSVGYNTVSHFNRTFKNREGISPLNYRKKYQKN